MTSDQLRQVLRELNGDREVAVVFNRTAENASGLVIKNAMLIPDEPDHTVKVTDGKHIYVIDPEHIAYIRIALKQPL